MKVLAKALCVVLLAACHVTPLVSQQLGGGLSFWVPESLYLGSGGSVGIESAIGTSIGLGTRFSVPVGIAYDKVYGLLPEGSTANEITAPWFISDSLLGSLMAKVHLPAGPFYLDIFGGLAGVWNMKLAVLSGAVERDMAAAGETLAFESPAVLEGGRFGWGWQAGGAIGISIGQVAVDLNVTYRLLRSAATLSGSYYVVTGGGPDVSGPVSFGPDDLIVRMAGFNVGIDIGFSM